MPLKKFQECPECQGTGVLNLEAAKRGTAPRDTLKICDRCKGLGRIPINEEAKTAGPEGRS